MKWVLAVVLTFTLVLSVIFSDLFTAEVGDDLVVSNPASCAGLDKLNNTQNPEDIFVGVDECLLEKNYETASYLIFAAYAYGKYDILRVKDTSSHKILSILRTNAFSRLDQPEVEELKKSFSAINSDEAHKKKLCDGLQVMGMPNYHPSYMIQIGMSAYTEQGDGLVENFDSAKAWETVTRGFAKCDSASS